MYTSLEVNNFLLISVTYLFEINLRFTLFDYKTCLISEQGKNMTILILFGSHDKY